MQSTTKSVTLADGNTCEFPRLHLDDLLALADAMKAEKVAIATRVAALPNTKPEHGFNLIVSAENLEFGVVEIWDACNNPRTAKQVLLKSLKRVGRDSEVATITAGMDMIDVVKLAQDLVSENLRPKDPAKQDGEGEHKSFKKPGDEAAANPQ